MNKSVPIIFFFAMASVPVNSGWADRLTHEITAPKSRTIQAPAKIVVTPPPAITISSPPNEGASTTQTSANITIAANKPVTICWQLDGGLPTCSSQAVTSFNAILTGLPPGNHTLETTATDTTGNTVTNSLNWRITN
jgi:hypothetical protein